MKRGRPAKLDAVKELAGNPGKRPLNKNAPKATGLPKAPVSVSGFAMTVWKELVGSMPPEVYTKADQYLMAAYCHAVALHEEAVTELALLPSKLVPGSTGQAVQSPWIKTMLEAQRQMVSIGTRLGLDPASRQAMQMSGPKPQKDDDEFAEYAAPAERPATH
jgi:P27 family predicted phage terminase small subunit